MSPEQARGERIDKRTDIWAFGCVLFEMLTGHTAFQGSTSTEILTAILERDADLGALPVATPANIQRLIARCLDKDTRQRLRDIGSGPHGRPVIEILPMEGQRQPRPFDEQGVTSRHPAFSPDGRWVAYVSNTTGRNEVYVRAYPDPGTPIPISTDGGEEPVWARSGRELFFRRGNAMMAVDIVAAPHRLSAGVPKQLFSGSYAAGGTRAGYDVSADAQKFILIKSSGATLNVSRFTVALNWLDALEARTSPGS